MLLFSKECLLILRLCLAFPQYTGIALKTKVLKKKKKRKLKSSPSLSLLLFFPVWGLLSDSTVDKKSCKLDLILDA